MPTLEPPSQDPLNILFVDDDFEDYQLTKAMLKSGIRRDFQIRWGEDFDSGLKALSDAAPDACLVDYHLGGLTGIDFVRQAQEKGFDGPIIILTGREDAELDQLALDAGAVDYLEKGTVNASMLARSIRYAIHRKQLERELLTMASRDALTGLRNRSSFDDELHRVISTSLRTRKEPALFLLDIDHFKRINDTLGHQVGDAVLKAVAQRLTSCSRDVDVVSRWGGDEFAIVAENVGSVTDAGQFARRIVEAVREPIEVDKTVIHATTSVGVLYCRPDIVMSPDVLKWADQALYRAKQQGRDGYAFFDESMNLQATRRAKLRQSVTGALQQQTLQFAGQPIVDVASGHVAGFELLARVPNADGGVVPIDELIHAVDDNNLIWDVTRTAIGQAGHWYQKYTTDPGQPKRVGVNISARQVQRPDCPRILKQMTVEANLPPEWIELGIPEQALSYDPVQARLILSQLRDAGFNLTLDSYRAATTPLMHLAKLPFDRIKIDRSLVAHVVDNKDIRLICECLVSLSKGLDFEVAALGVEDQAQSELLEQMGCNLQQGYYFARPALINEQT